MRHFIIVDGASSGNGLSAGIGIVVKDQSGKTIESVGTHIGQKTNNEAEYQAVIDALKLAKLRGFDDVTILTDSNLVYSQIKGDYKVKEKSLRPYFDQVMTAKLGVKKITFDFVPREYTHEADELARGASEQGIEKEVEKKYPFLTHQK